MWPVIRQAFGCWICNAKHRFAGQTTKVFAFMLVLSPLLWCWHHSVRSAHPCSFWLHRESLVLCWESKWCQHCGRREGQNSLKARRVAGTVSWPAAANSPWSRQPAGAGAMGHSLGSGGGWAGRVQHLQWGFSHHLCHDCIRPSYYKIHFYRIEYNIRELIFTLEYRVISSLCTVSCSAAQISWTQNVRNHQIATTKN